MSSTAASTAPQVADDNPLPEGLERLPVHPTTLAIFGATGDLARRKLLPAIYNLAHDGALPERFKLSGVSRREMSDEDFREDGRRGGARVLAPRARRRAADAAARGRASTSPGTFDDADALRGAAEVAAATSTTRPASG